MPSPSVTYTFSNSTTADATQVNQNFTDILNGMSDGTKDFSISALTCAGVVTLNANTTIGNASSDDLTITASLASTIPIKTTNSYNIGSATKGLQYIYFGSSAGANTTRMVGAAVSADVQLLLPDASGTLALAPAATSKTTTYQATTADGLILCSGSAFTVTLYTAVGNAGKKLTIKKTDSTVANIITIDGDGSETIDGSLTKTLNSQYESYTIVSDGSNWHVTEYKEDQARNVVRLHTANGHGSTNTTIRRFSTSVEATGSAITYADSSTAGATFTINVDGIYAITYCDQFNASDVFGISLNSSQLTTAISAITAADRLSSGVTPAANSASHCSWTGPLSAGDVIRPHTNGSASGAAGARTNFTIAKIG
jgi:hypothetical protein